jgi:hypothetical protein
MGRDGVADDALSTFLASMRRTRDEAQFTQMIAGACASDPRFAGDLVRAMTRSAAGGDERLRVPVELSCRAEKTVFSNAGHDLGRVDLVFRDKEGFTLLVELKLHSAYGHDQLDRYRRALDAVPGSTRFLVAVTVNSPFSGEDSVSGDPRWLGSVRWSQIFTELRAMKHRSSGVESAWRAALDLMRKQGDSGLMDFDPSAVSAWARALEGEQVLKHLLREAARPVAAMLAETAEPIPAAHLIARGKNQTQPVVPWRGRLHVPYAVGSSTTEPRFRIQFLARDGAVSFSCEARYEHPKEQVMDVSAINEASVRLRKSGYAVDRDGEGWYWAKATDPTPWLMSPDPLQAMLEFTKSAVDELAASSIWNALGGVTPSTPTEQGEDPLPD